MNYYGINRKVNVAGYVKDYKSPVTKAAEAKEVCAVIGVPRDERKLQMAQMFVDKYKMTTMIGARPSDPFGKTISVYGPSGKVDELKKLING